jgi:hypothetical protein
MTWSVPAMVSGDNRSTSPSGDTATTVGCSTTRPGSRANIGYVDSGRPSGASPDAIIRMPGSATPTTTARSHRQRPATLASVHRPERTGGRPAQRPSNPSITTGAPVPSSRHRQFRTHPLVVLCASTRRLVIDMCDRRGEVDSRRGADL